MREIDSSLKSILKSAIEESLNSFEHAGEDNFLGDLYLQYREVDHTLTFFDDRENELFIVQINKEDICPDWIQAITRVAKQALEELEKEKIFERKFICKPFAVSLIDVDFIVTEQLFFMDDNNVKPTSSLWVWLSKELDNFLKDLML